MSLSPLSQVYVFGIELDGFKFDREQLLRITGDKEHVFVFQNTFNNLTPKNIEDLTKHFCANPCNHVLHEHQ